MMAMIDYIKIIYLLVNQRTNSKKGQELFGRVPECHISGVFSFFRSIIHKKQQKKFLKNKKKQQIIATYPERPRRCKAPERRPQQCCGPLELVEPTPRYPRASLRTIPLFARDSKISLFSLSPKRCKQNFGHDETF